jgi:UrcA family protein
MKTISIFRSALATIVAASALFTAIAPASAEDSNVSVHIPLDRFDLTKPADRRAILWRVRTSARQACGVSNASEIDEPAEVRRCLRDALKSGAEQLAALQPSHRPTLALADIGAAGHSR